VDKVGFVVFVDNVGYVDMTFKWLTLLMRDSEGSRAVVFLFLQIFIAGDSTECSHGVAR